MDLKLDDKISLVTASSGGIGYAVAFVFSPRASTINEASLRVNGGLVRSII